MSSKECIWNTVLQTHDSPSWPKMKSRSVASSLGHSNSWTHSVRSLFHSNNCKNWTIGGDIMLNGELTVKGMSSSFFTLFTFKILSWWIVEWGRCLDRTQKILGWPQLSISTLRSKEKWSHHLIWIFCWVLWKTHHFDWSSLSLNMS